MIGCLEFIIVGLDCWKIFASNRVIFLDAAVMLCSTVFAIAGQSCGLFISPNESGCELLHRLTLNLFMLSKATWNDPGRWLKCLFSALLVIIYMLFCDAQMSTKGSWGVSVPSRYFWLSIKGETNDGLLLWRLHFSMCSCHVFRFVWKLNIVCVICQCLRLYFFWDIFKEWFGVWEPRFPANAFFKSCPTSKTSFQCNYLLDLNHWPVKTTAIWIYEKRKLWN